MLSNTEEQFHSCSKSNETKVIYKYSNLCVSIFTVKIIVANLTRSDGEDDYVPTKESFVAAPSCIESKQTLANSYDKHQLIEYISSEIESNQNDLDNPMVQHYCNGEMWTFIYNKVKRFQVALEYYTTISQNDWDKCVAFANDRPGLSADVDDFYSFAVSIASLSVGQTSILNGFHDMILPQSITLDDFSQFCTILNEWNDFCCSDVNIDMLDVVLSEYAMDYKDNDLTKVYAYVAWNIKCQDCNQSLNLKL